MQPGKDAPGQIQPHTGTFGLQIGHTKGADLPFHRREDRCGLFTARRFEVVNAPLKLLVRLRENVEQVVQIRPRVVFAVVPAGGGLFERFVVALLVLLDQAFEADVASHFKTAVIQRLQQQETGSAPVADLVVVRSFGDPIYPALVPVDRVERGGPDKPWHLLINADNFHALQLLLYCYEGQVDMIYIDPPYNTGARDWKYNNDYVDKTDTFRHSKWLSMMKKRLLLAKRLLKIDGVLVVTIDDHELPHLLCLLEEIFQGYKFFTIVIEHNKRGRQGEEFARSHEYAVFAVPQGEGIIGEEPLESSIGGETRNLRRTGNNSLRVARPGQFYPIYVNERSLEVTGFGKPLPKDAKRNSERVEGSVPVWPIDKLQVERNWHYGPERAKKEFEAGKLFAARQPYGIQIYYTLKEKQSKRWKTVWSKPQLDASTHGSELLVDIFGGPSGFSYPKSLYAVCETLMPVMFARKKGLVLDFFAGSGTTLHATALLNAEDDGLRRCILVTNNEVNEKTIQELEAKGIFQGEAEFEQQGIANKVTWPRCKSAVSGKRDDGTDLPGAYITGSALKDGFTENIEYFKLDFLDSSTVARGDAFAAILPLLWMMAGCRGKREESKGSQSWFIPKHAPFAVLIKEKEFRSFRDQLADRKDIEWIFLVTDSEENFGLMRRALGRKFQCVQLYKSYLENFRLNTPEALGQGGAA